MKKLLLGCVLLSTFSFASDKYIEVKMGGDIDSSYRNLQSRKYFVKDTRPGTSFEMGAEFMKKFTDNVDLGVGVSYQRHDKRAFGRSFSFFVPPPIAYTGYYYSSIPVYLILKYKFENKTNFTPYLKLDIGYSYNLKEVDEQRIEGDKFITENTSFRARNGAYWAVATGVEYKNLILEVIYSETNSNFQSFGEEYPGGDYRRVGVTIGYKFNF